jgi:acetyl esterase
LEPDVAAFLATAGYPPYSSELSPFEGRMILEDLQSGLVEKPDVEIEDIIVFDRAHEVEARIVRPRRSGVLPVILYVHGPGWMYGDRFTHDRLVRELAVGANAAVVFPEYVRSPDAQYPSAIDECWTVARWVRRHGAAYELDGTRMAVAGDGAGANIAIALAFLAKASRAVTFAGQALFYPVTDASCDTPSYTEFAEGFYLRRDDMRWFWHQYTSSGAERDQIGASPLRATVRQLQGLPAAFVATAEADVVRDEGEAFAAKLREAGVDVTAVRYDGVIHGFMMLDALRCTDAAQAATHDACTFLRASLRVG